MKRTILALALVATTLGAFAQTPTPAAKPVVKKEKSHKKVGSVTPKPVEKKKSGK